MTECGHQRNILTDKQEMFCRLKALGKTGADAYREAFNSNSKSTDRTIYQKSSNLMGLPKIVNRIAELRENTDRTYLWTRNIAIMHLLEIVEKKVPAYALGAIKELNIMHGFDKPSPNSGDESDDPIGITVTIHDARKPQPIEIH